MHAEACSKGLDYYLDPNTGYRVFSAKALESFGKCCGCSCRHCPFGHENVPHHKRYGLRQDPWMLENNTHRIECDVLSWSGGKDSFLALKNLAAENKRDVILMTTFDGRTGQVAHQDVHIDDIKAQAESLGINLMLVPLYPQYDYLSRIELALQRVLMGRPVKRLAFGDLHLEHIRDWRETHLGPLLSKMGISSHYPNWLKPYAVLEKEFFGSRASATVSAVANTALSGICEVGDEFSPQLLDKLPVDIDRFGENGEFHTLVMPPKGGWRKLAG